METNAKEKQISVKQQQPFRAEPTDDIINSDLGTAGTSEFIQGQHLSSQQQPLRALAPHAPPQQDPHHLPSAGAPANTLVPRDASLGFCENKYKEGQKSTLATPFPSLSLSQGPKSLPQKSKNIPLSPMEMHTVQASPTSASEVKLKSRRESEDDHSTYQFTNLLQQKLDDELQEYAPDVIQEVSGGQQDDAENSNRPFDPNLICPMCMKKFRCGEIQLFKRHFNTCPGTDDEPGDGDGVYNW